MQPNRKRIIPSIISLQSHRPIDHVQILPPNILLTNIARTNQNAIFNVAFIFDLLFLIDADLRVEGVSFLS